MADINAESYREKMEELITRHGLSTANLYFEDAPVKKYAISRCSKIEGKIYFKRVVKDEDRAAYMQSLTRQFEDKLELIQEDWMLIKHSLLHEICHIIARYRDDYECNKWAFYEVKK